MVQIFSGLIEVIIFFAVLGYFSWGVIKRDIVFGIRGNYSGGFHFKGISAIIISLASIGFLLYGLFTLGIPNYSFFQWLIGGILGFYVSHGIHDFVINIHPVLGVETSKKQFKGDFIFWIVFGTMLSLLIAFFGFMISRSILITIATFLVPFSIVLLFGYAFSKFNSGR